MTTTEDHTERIRALNDTLRRTGNGGTVYITKSIDDLAENDRTAIERAVATFDHFTEDNDPWGEHDCATLTVGEHQVMFKIDYYDLALESLSPAPWDASQTRRVLTILLAQDY